MCYCFRLCKKLGYHSYKEFIHQVEEETYERLQINQLIEKEPFQKDTTINEITQIMPELYHTIVQKTNLLIHQKALENVVKHLKEAAYVDIYCTGITSSCGSAAMFKFMSIGISCHLHDTVNEHYIMEIKDKAVVAETRSSYFYKSG